MAEISCRGLQTGSLRAQHVAAHCGSVDSSYRVLLKSCYQIYVIYTYIIICN